MSEFTIHYMTVVVRNLYLIPNNSYLCGEAAE